MSNRVTVDVRNFRHMLSIALAGVTLAVVLSYALGAQAILQSPYAEPMHDLYMSIYAPLIGVMSGDHSSLAQMHGGPAADSQMQGSMGILANNMLGSPAGMAAAGFAAVTIQGAIVFAAATSVVSWKQRSFVVAGLLAASGVVLMILPLANMNLEIPGPIMGVVVGLAILGLGVEKAVRTARAGATKTR